MTRSSRRPLRFLLGAALSACVSALAAPALASDDGAGLFTLPPDRLTPGEREAALPRKSFSEDVVAGFVLRLARAMTGLRAPEGGASVVPLVFGTTGLGVRVEGEL